MRRSLFLTGLLVTVFLLVTGSPAYGELVVKPVTYYVNDDAGGANDGTSWENAFTDLQSALAVAQYGDSIWVAAGTYKPSASIDSSTDTRTVSFSLKSGVALYGGFSGDELTLVQRSLDPSTTVLSGDIGVVGSVADNSYHVLYADGVTEAVLNGFTVTGGRGDRASGHWELLSRDTRGGGMYADNSWLTVSDCVFRDNTVAGRQYNSVACGGGMYNRNSAATVTGSLFTSNYAGNQAIPSWGHGGGMYNFGYYNSDHYSGSPRIVGCTFSDNTALGVELDDGGGGVYNEAGQQTIEACTFTRNLGANGGGMLNYMGAPIISNCLFDTNSTTRSDGRGGAISNVANATILNCTFYQNGWRMMPPNYPGVRFRPFPIAGGAISDTRAGSTITNCIFSNNASRFDAGAVDARGVARPKETLATCLFYENVEWDIGHDDRRISHVEGNYTDSGSLFDVDPLLADPTAGDFHLMWDSPCVDAGYRLKHGNLSWPTLPATDFYGGKRVVDGDSDDDPVVDIGADEYVPDTVGLRGFLATLSASGTIDAALGDRLIGYVDSAEAALTQGDELTANVLLGELIVDVRASLGETETELLIEQRTQAVIEEI